MDKLNLTPFNIEQIKEYSKCDLVNGFIIGSHQFGLRQVVNFELHDIKKIRELTNKKLYISVNRLFHNKDLEELTDYLKELEFLKVDGIIFSDIGIYTIWEENNFKFELIYNTETTITNHYFSEMAGELGISTIELAKEITLEEIKEIANLKKSKISVNVHGHIYMFQSVRKMIDNYENVQGIKVDNDKNYFLYDEERSLYYPLIQNEQGTHLLASNDICMINRLDRILNNDIDYLKIDGFLYHADEYKKIVDLYIEAMQMENEQYEKVKDKLLEKIKLVNKNKTYSTGFYFKKTIY